jgi:hypothetical protein
LIESGFWVTATLPAFIAVTTEWERKRLLRSLTPPTGRESMSFLPSNSSRTVHAVRTKTSTMATEKPPAKKMPEIVARAIHRTSHVGD